jgi:cation diffusion facilitator CzcD-associated flavoprotein CzcO
VGLATLLYRASRRWPDRVRAMIRAQVKSQLPDGYEVDTHFKPRYDPWDQRMCIVPRGDLFQALRSGRASIATGDIDTFTETGIRLSSGEEIEADIVVTATGLNLLAFGGIELSVDGREVSLPDKMAYKGMMLSDVPNFAFAIGYTNASWTLKVDLTRERRPLGRGDAAARLRGRLRAALARPVPQAGLEGAVEAAPELPCRRGDAALRQGHRRGDEVQGPMSRARPGSP